MIGFAGMFSSYGDKEKNTQKVNHTLYVMHERINALRPHNVKKQRGQASPIGESNNDASDIEVDLSASRNNLLDEGKKKRQKNLSAT